MSQKVLERRSLRQRKLRERVFVGLFPLAACAMLGAITYDTHEARLAEGAPTWADFKAYSPSTQVHLSTINDGIPSTVHINGELWHIDRVAHFKAAEATGFGIASMTPQAETYCDKNLIVYIEDQDPRNLRATIAHELFHAGACAHGGDTWWNSESVKEHKGVYHLGEFMAEVMRQNPAMAEWLAQ